MIKVKFFGILRLTLGKGSIEIEAVSVSDLINKLCKLMPDASYTDLRNSIIFINDTEIVKLKGYRTKLQSGDTVMFMSPVSGG